MPWKCDKCSYSLNTDDDERCAICHQPNPDRSDESINSNRGSKPSREKLTSADTNETSRGQRVNPNEPDIHTTQPSNNHNNIDQSQNHQGDISIFSGPSSPSGPSNPSDNSIPEQEQLPSDNPNGGNILRGRVSHLDLRDERPPVNIYRTLSWVLITIMVIIPFGTFFILSGLVSLAFAIIGFQTLSQLFNPITWTHTLTEMVEVVVLRRFRSDDRVPIFRGMVEDRNNQEYSFLMYGPLQSGNLIIGQVIELNGQWQNGSFLVQNGNDLDTGAAIISSYRNPWRVIFFSLLSFMAILGVLLLLNWNHIQNSMG